MRMKPITSILSQCGRRCRSLKLQCTKPFAGGELEPGEGLTRSVSQHHPLNLTGVIGGCQRQHQQNPRLFGRKIVGNNVPLFLETAREHNPAVASVTGDHHGGDDCNSQTGEFYSETSSISSFTIIP